jgi:hypothetical protein
VSIPELDEPDALLEELDVSIPELEELDMSIPELEELDVPVPVPPPVPSVPKGSSSLGQQAKICAMVPRKIPPKIFTFLMFPSALHYALQAVAAKRRLKL